MSWITSKDALLVAGPAGEILYKKNEAKKCVPASTLKILTSLAAIHHLGRSYRFRTEFYLDPEQNLKVKGYGDPLLISEVWEEIAQGIAPRLHGFKDLILDDTYFAHDIHIPGVVASTNPYDAPNGAICANFNTVFFKHNQAGRLVSAEPQTPMTPLALERVRLLGLKPGRYTFSHDRREAALYAGELLVHFLKETGADFQGKIRTGVVGSQDRLVYTYRSLFPLEEVLRKMLEFSNNFMANQILIALGARVHGPPGTLAKGVIVLSDYTQGVLHLKDVELAEGSGVSRKNRLTAVDMLSALKAFEPHRGLLTRKGRLLYKRGTLSGIRARAGYIECGDGRHYYFVIFIGRPDLDADDLMVRIEESLDNSLRLIPE
ncbi:MAG: D-alanyl-D-alanine carboxypeptidase [Desulfobacterales bacterium]|nr:D-alanyl-D-alanine carboxypeptidase [Desulfobacterales bacterium]